MSVWLITSGEYSDYRVAGIAETMNDAVEYLRRAYKDQPVKWSNVLYERYKDNEKAYPYIIGEFESVPGKCAAHTTRFDLDERDVLRY